jgi:hypothetical protein
LRAKRKALFGGRHQEFACPLGGRDQTSASS